MNVKKIKAMLKDNVNLSLYKAPFTIEKYYGRDDEKTHYGDPGKDPICNHLIQDVDYKKIKIQYKFNSFGLRGPEPNAKKSDKKILFAGGSFCFGTGLNVEDTFPYILSEMMGADYLNLSDVDSLTELIPYLKDIKSKFNPDYFVLCDTRFINEIDWIRTFTYQNISEGGDLDMTEIIKTNEIRRRSLKLFELEDYETNHLITKNELKRFANEMFNIEAMNTMTMFDSFCKDIFNIPMAFVYFDRKLFTSKEFEFKNLRSIKINKKEVVDIARDNVHPGPKTNYYIANLVKSKLEE